MLMCLYSATTSGFSDIQLEQYTMNTLWCKDDARMKHPMTLYSRWSVFPLVKSFVLIKNLYEFEFGMSLCVHVFLPRMLKNEISNKLFCNHNLHNYVVLAS